MFQGKTILIGVSGGIAAYKIPNLVSMLVKQHADVHVILTRNAEHFIPAAPFETLTKNPVVTDVFEDPGDVSHITLGKKADVVLIAPATANIIGKCANGIADDMLSTTVLACRCPCLIAPSMNTRMYENPVVQDNLKKLAHYGWIIIDAKEGHLACGDDGAGKMPEPEELFRWIEKALWNQKDYVGKKVLVTAGPTCESLDPVRYLTNHSSGKMGYAVAKAAMLRGADVTLVSGPVQLEVPLGVKVIPVVSAEDMYQAVTAGAQKADVVIKAAAVADYTPADVADEKIKKSQDEVYLKLKKTKDILKTLGDAKAEGKIHAFLCGFSMETEDMAAHSREKLEKKHLDMICANNVKVQGAGFAGDTNVLTLITADGEKELPLMSKEAAAHVLLDEIKAKVESGSGCAVRSIEPQEEQHGL